MAKTQFTTSVKRNLKIIQSILTTDDLIVRELTLIFGQGSSTKGVVVYLDGLVDDNTLNSEVLRPMLIDAKCYPGPDTSQLLEFLKQSLLTAGDLSVSDTPKETVLTILSGGTALLIDGINQTLSINTKGWERRSIQPPQTEAVIRGPRDSFTENIAVNLMLIRRRIRDPHLVFKRHRLGSRGQNDAVVAYLDGVVKTELVREVDKRLKEVDLDVILDSGLVEQMIEDVWWSPFTTLQDTERPDATVAALLEGRVAIFVDNTPFVLLAPTTFVSQVHSPEDYYLRWPAVNFIRLLRFFALFVATLTPALYVALVAYHPEMIPTELALSIIATREAIPLPSFLEALVMEASLELLREAGIRLPSPIGQTIGIVGGLIIGDAAVRASLVSPIMVIVVAITAIAGFVIPSYSFGLGVRLLRFFLIILATTLGLYGVTLGILVILGHLCTLTSFGVSYLAPWAPFSWYDWRDSVFRQPIHLLNRRPSFMRTRNPVRQPRKDKKTKRRLR